MNGLTDSKKTVGRNLREEVESPRFLCLGRLAKPWKPETIAGTIGMILGRVRDSMQSQSRFRRVRQHLKLLATRANRHNARVQIEEQLADAEAMLSAEALPLIEMQPLAYASVGEVTAIGMPSVTAYYETIPLGWIRQARQAS